MARMRASGTLLRAFCVALFAMSAAIVVAGCQSILGIEDRSYEPASQQCIDYCNTVDNNCTGDNQVYAEGTCLGICAKLAPGNPSEPANDDTVACRARFAEAAASAPTENCVAAGPGGGGTCGSDCESYCTLLEGICPAEYNIVPDCVAKCAALEDKKTFNVVHDHEGDTVQCRLVHLGAATKDPETHCQHAQFQSTAFCVDDPTAAATCDAYCRAVTAACTGKLAQYDSEDQCLMVCAAMTPGTFGDEGGNTVGCRHFHSFNALADPTTHCPHSGLGGDGVCSKDNCEPYCQVLETACSSEFSTQFKDQFSCQAACQQIGGAAAGTLESSAGAPLRCRLSHLAKALSDPQNAATECAAALGQGC